ncbi:hypothetical protein A9Q99_21310 [Gammaproteobacteria bacterium 45_16_T64]|nr:hypothetical protein A9Q99_21310 [Gammaproteobacteria bacterium 45_16_T64]
MNQSRPQGRITRFVISLFSIMLLTACAGENASNTDSSSAESSAAADNTQSEIIDNPNVVEDGYSTADEEVNTYYRRDADYPNAVDLPLQFITTKGGKKLSVRVTLPGDKDGNPLEGPFPVILTQSGYNTNLLSYMFLGSEGFAMMGLTDAYIVRRGYAQVAVDALGTGASEGGWELLGEDEQIGFADAVDWAHNQPWVNGKLGVAGVSYMAISSLFAAQRRPDSVDAVFALLPMGDAMRGTVGIGGLLNGVFMSTWMSITHLTSTQNIPAMLANPQHTAQLMAATQEHIDHVDIHHVPMIENALDGAPKYSYDGEFWQTRSPMANIDKVTAPTFIFGALNDLFQRGAPMLYERLSDNGVDSHLVVYSGTHLINFLKSHVASGEQVPAIDFLLLQWFDKHLKGMDTKTEKLPPVIQYVKNYPTESTPAEFQNDSYATAAKWPHPLLSPERWYLHGDGSLTQTKPTEPEPHFTMRNPEHPVGGARNANGLLVFDITLNDGTKCSSSYEQWTLGLVIPEPCYYDSNLSEQERVLFDSDTMEEDYYINGPIQADIWIDSTVTDAVVAVQVEEVFGDRSLPISNGQLLASKRAVDISRSRIINNDMIQPYHYFTEATSEPLVPGEVIKMQIEIFPTSAIIRKGNKLRIAISPSNQAQGIMNYPLQAAAEGGITTIHNSPEYPSSIVLPIVPTSALD